MRRMLTVVVFAVGLLAGEEFDPRLSIHTLVREDIFAGLLEGDFERMGRGEKTVEALLPQRPKSRPDLLAWKAGAKLRRAIAAHEAKQPEEFRKFYNEATALFREAASVGQTLGLAAVQGGTYVMLADRLPDAERQASWQDAYAAYRTMHRMQEKIVDKLPVHQKGELLAGLAMSAQRTGKAEEAAQWLDRILASMPDTPYAARAVTWKSKPELMSRTGLACQTCHEPGRLAPTKAALAKQP